LILTFANRIYNMADLPLNSTPQVDPSSTPLNSDNPVFSDEPFAASSPPSSPPEFPWEDTASTKYHGTPSKPARSIANAFSVLGKRKALTSINDNARSTKKQPPTASKKDGKPLTQMQISLGQEVQKKCKDCGMEYIASSDEDRKLHDKYHKQNVEGYDVGKDFLTKARGGTVFETLKKGDSIAAVDGHDNIWRRKRARAALDVVQRELGAVDIPDKLLWDPSCQHLPDESNISRHTVYMYVRQNKCIGLLLVEQIIEGNKVLQPATKRPRAEDVPAKAKMSALERLREKRALQKESEAEPQSIQLATKTSPAFLGVSRIWTSPSHRGQGVAQSLLDRALEHHNTRITQHNHSDQTVVDRSKVDSGPTLQAPTSQRMEPITKDHVAFSQPTEVGAKLARKWTGKKYGWLVYSA
jgi:N-acetyltransferase